MFGLFKKKKFDISSYKEDAFLEKQWIEHFFAVHFQKPKDVDHMEYLTYLHGLKEEGLRSLVIYSAQTIEVGKSVSIQAYFVKDLPPEYYRVLRTNSNENSYFMLIRFPNAKKEHLEKGTVDFEKGNISSLIDPSEKRNYKFSPLQSIKFLEVSKSVEHTLYVLSGVKPHQVMTYITNVDDEIIVYEFDGLQYLSYPLSQRAELYSKYPELNTKIFIGDFKEFTNWVISKENDNETMKRNADLTRKILRKFNL